ncbi:tetratricopeptide repeat protein [Amycolatopsis japonica]
MGLRFRIPPRRRRPAGDAEVQDHPSLWDDYLARAPEPSTPDDTDEETRWREAADNGDIDAMFALYRHFEAEGRAADAEQWCRRAATAGHVKAMAAQGFLHQQRGANGEARFWWRQAAESGDVFAKYRLATQLERDGELEEAERWYRAAAGDDHVLAQTQLAYLLHQRRAEQDAEHWWRRAAEHNHLTALYNLGARAEDDGRPRDAETWWRRAADLGHLDSTLRLATLLTEEQDERAGQWWERAASEHPYAARQAALLREQQRRRKAFEGEKLSGAVRVWKFRAQNGDADPMFHLALYYHENRQPEDADTWLLAALHAGSTAVLTYLNYVRYRAEHTDRPALCEHARAQRSEQTSTGPLTPQEAENMINCRIRCGSDSPYRSH